MVDIPGNGGESRPRLWWWKDWEDYGGRYCVGLINVTHRDWFGGHLSRMDVAVVDDFGNLVAVPA